MDAGFVAEKGAGSSYLFVRCSYSNGQVQKLSGGSQQQTLAFTFAAAEGHGREVLRYWRDDLQTQGFTCQPEPEPEQGSGPEQLQGHELGTRNQKRERETCSSSSDTAVAGRQTKRAKVAEPSGKRTIRLECKNDRSNKFYEIVCEGR